MPPDIERTNSADEIQRAKMRSEIAATLEKEEANTQALEEAMGEENQEQQKILDGSDLDFDPLAFIAYGRIAKKDIPVLKADEESKFPGLYVDMQSLTSEEKTLAKTLLRMGLPELPVGGIEWNDNLVKATVTMALTRMNNRAYPIPVPNAPDYKQNMVDKLELFKFVCKAQDFVAEMLRMLYINLSNADTLKQIQGEDVLKK